MFYQISADHLRIRVLQHLFNFSTCQCLPKTLNLCSSYSRQEPPDIQGLHCNPLTAGGAFCQKCIFLLLTFWWFSGWISTKLASNLVEKTFATQQFALLATSIMFYNILARACTEIKILSFWTRKWPTSLGFSIFEFFFRFSFFLLFFSFCWPSSGLACSLKSSKKASSRGGKFDHGVAMCRGRKFCSKFFTQCLSIYVHI